MSVSGSAAPAQISVLGGGPWSAVLADLLTEGGATVRLFVDDDDVRLTLAAERSHPSLPGVTISPRVALVDTVIEAATADLVFFGVHPFSFRTVAREAGAVIRGHQILVTASRGLELGTGATLSAILREETCARKIGALAGPRLTLEIAQGAPGSAVIGSPFSAVTDAVCGALTSDRFRVYDTDDRIGVEVGGALASCLSFVAGVAEGMGLGSGAQAVALTRGLREVSRLGVALGARPETFSGMSCLGVFLGACLSRTRREYVLGLEVGQAGIAGEASARLEEELGLTAEAAVEIARGVGVEIPLVKATWAILRGGVDPRLLRESLMARPSRAEEV